MFYCCRCNAYCNETGRLSQTYDQLVSENNYLKSNNQSVVDKYNALLNQFNLLNSQYLSNLSNTDIIKKKNARQIAQVTDECDKLQERNKMITLEIIQVTNELNKLKEHNKKITFENAQLSKKIDEIDSEYTKKSVIQQQKFDDKCSEFNKLKSQLAKKSIEYKSINDKLQELKTQYSKKQEEFAHQSKINKDLEIKVASLSNSLTQSKKRNEEMSKASKKHRKEINKLNETHRKSLEKSEEHHLNVLTIMGEGDKLTIQKLEEENQKMKKCIDNLHKSNNDFLEIIEVYDTSMEGFLQRHIVDIDVTKKTLERPFFSQIKQQTLVSMLAMIDIHYRRLMMSVDHSSVLVNEVQASIFLRHFYQCLTKLLGKTKDKDILHCLLPYNTPYKLKRLFVLSRFSFNTFIEILTTHIPQAKIKKTRDLIMSSLITTKEDAELTLHILNVKKCKSGKYFRYCREFIDKIKDNGTTDLLQFKIDAQSRFTEDYVINTMCVNNTAIWANIIQKYARDLPKIQHDIVPIVKCGEILKKKIDSSE
jgi:septal ring factor EnvC (AmiA/AmiB activator)